MVKPVWNNTQRVNRQNFAKMTHPCAKKNMVPREVLMKSGLVSVNTARQVNVAHSKTTVNDARPMGKKFNTARPKAVVNAVKGNNNAVKASACWVWKPKHKVLDHGNPQMDLQDQGVIDSGCSRYMIGNMSYLTNYKEIDGGYVAFGGNPKGGKITGKCTIKTGNLDFKNVYFVRELKFNLFSVSQMCDKKNSVLFNDTECIVLSPNFKLIDESQVLLRVPRKNNMYSVDLKNIVPKGGLTCLFAKATSDESKLWHRRLGHLNFKTMNKLVKGNLVRGLPSKLFENDQTCVACQKGKQHRASCKSKTENSISLPLHLLHMDLFGPTFVKSLMKKMYCLVVTDDYSRFTWVFFLATKDETSGILKSFITGIENLVDHKVKLELLNKINGVAEMRRNKKTNEVSRTMLADSKVPTLFWAEAVNTVMCISTQIERASPARKEIEPVKNTIATIVGKLDPPLSQDQSDYRDDDAEADMNNLDTTIQVSPIPTIRIHKDHPFDQVIGDLQSVTQTRMMSKKFEEHGKNPKRFIVVKTASTPMETQKPLLKDKDGEEVDVHMYSITLDKIVGAILDRKSTTGGCQFLRCRLISWQCKKQTVVANSIIEAEYVAASSCCGQVPQPSGPTYIVVDEAIHKELGDSLVRAATTTSSLEAEQDSGNITKSRSKATPNEAGSQGTTSGGGLRRQEIIGDNIAQTRFKNVFKLSNDPLLARGQGQVNKGRRPVKTMKKKDLIRLDKETAKRLQAEFDEEERLAGEKDKANVALTEEWDDIQAKIEADHELAKKLQGEEQEELSGAEKATLFIQLLKKRRKYFAAKSAEEKRNKPPTQAQQRKIMCTYRKNMEGKKPKDMKNKSLILFQRCLTELSRG
ncbi:putative ribonuclease H-like domain-containing protein [Tanacetum coccineum]